jgi:hypothetical protein
LKTWFNAPVFTSLSRGRSAQDLPYFCANTADVESNTAQLVYPVAGREKTFLKQLLEQFMAKSSLVLALLAALACTTAQATLIDRSGGMVYDTVLDLTWLRDANYGVTSGLIPAGSLGNGGVDWGSATRWAADLNYGGYTGWRLPTTLVPDSSCLGYYGEGKNFDRGAGCKGSELGELFYTEGGLTAGQSILTSAILSSHFVNMQSAYWSNTEVATTPYNAYLFFTIGNGLISSGVQVTPAKANNFDSAWAVHPGDIGVDPTKPSSVPEPSTVMLMGLALAGLGAMRRRGNIEALGCYQPD